MKIVVLGPTGMIGSAIVSELNTRGHEVIGASRASGTDVTDPDAVAAAASGADAVVCATSARGVDYTLADVARSVVAGVRASDAKRLVVVGGPAASRSRPGCG
jgi:putative NADH-flavin reductase